MGGLEADLRKDIQAFFSSHLQGCPGVQVDCTGKIGHLSQGNNLAVKVVALGEVIQCWAGYCVEVGLCLAQVPGLGKQLFMQGSQLIF